MSEIFITNETDIKVNTKKLQKIIEYILNKIKKNKNDISLAITGDKTIKKWNKIYRKIDSPTDILAFSGEENFLGEILISFEQIKRQAGKFNHTAYEEFVFILIHGLLHLAGYEDNTTKKKKIMIELGEKYFNELKMTKLL